MTYFTNPTNILPGATRVAGLAVAAVAVAVAAGVTGCTDISVSRVDPAKPWETPGMRYALPKPFIQVTSQIEGPPKVEVVYLPDEDATYGIEVSSVLAAHEYA